MAFPLPRFRSSMNRSYGVAIETRIFRSVLHKTISFHYLEWPKRCAPAPRRPGRRFTNAINWFFFEASNYSPGHGIHLHYYRGWSSGHAFATILGYDRKAPHIFTNRWDGIFARCFVTSNFEVFCYSRELVENTSIKFWERY